MVRIRWQLKHPGRPAWISSIAATAITGNRTRLVTWDSALPTDPFPC